MHAVSYTRYSNAFPSTGWRLADPLMTTVPALWSGRMVRLKIVGNRDLSGTTIKDPHRACIDLSDHGDG